VTVSEALRLGAARLATAGVDNPRLDARLLLARAAGLSQAALLADPNRPVDPDSYEVLLARRLAREPVAYILGTQEFWSLPFLVSPSTLIPRADSETVVEAALAAQPAPRRVLDLGTGTGCLLLAVLHERPGAWGLGVDRAPDAAILARANAIALGLTSRAAVLVGDWAAALAGTFDLILSNPPYVASAEMATLQPEVGRWEPCRALDGGADGLDAYRALAAVLPGLLAADGVAVLEVGAGQATAVESMARGAGLHHSGSRRDLPGIERALVLRAD